MLLRKLRIPLKQIAELLKSGDAMRAVVVFEQQVTEINAQINALETLRAILGSLIERLNLVEGVRLKDQLLSDEQIMVLVQGIPSEKSTLLKEDVGMNDLTRVGESLGQLKDVRIVYLPPSYVAASHYVGDEPEDVAMGRIFEFARAEDIARIKPDVRLYGFNHPNPVDETGAHGYELWLTIPDDMEVPPPLVKQRFEGGLYAAHMIRMGDFQEWELLDNWVQTNGEYVYNGSGTHENMFGSLEEQLNVYSRLGSDGDLGVMQLDLLIPVRRV